MKQFLQLFPLYFRQLLGGISLEFSELREIRIRAEKPIIIRSETEEWAVLKTGELSKNYLNGVTTSLSDILDILEYVCNTSVYAYEEELKKGYLTVQGGHRIGISGTVTMEADRVKTFRYIAGMNIRVAHEQKGSADFIYPQLLYAKHGFYNTLIISAPGVGKTTLLRDIVRQASEYGKFQVCVVDERSEIAGCYMGVAQNELGLRTDVLDNCTKAEGMMMAVRALTPDIVAADEIGCREDVHAINMVLRCGCHIIATVHGTDIEDIIRKPVFEQLIREGVFERYIILKGSAGHYLTDIYATDFSKIGSV